MTDQNAEYVSPQDAAKAWLHIDAALGYPSKDAGISEDLAILSAFIGQHIDTQIDSSGAES